MADLTTLLSKFLNALYAGTLYSSPLGGTTTGVPVIRAYGRSTAQVAAVASVATFTVGAADGTFEVSANVNVTTATTHTFGIEIAYTDETNAARIQNPEFSLIGGNFTNSISNTNGVATYVGVVYHIRAKAATSITIRTQAAGTYTTVVYNVEGLIKQVA